MIRYISAMPSPEWEHETPRTLALLGSTGSIGTSALRVVEAHPHRFRVVALAGARNVEKLAAQQEHYKVFHTIIIKFSFSTP